MILSNVITKGNESGMFEVVHKHGVWALHFRHRLKAPGKFHLEITGQKLKEKSNDLWEAPLVLHIQLAVTP